MTRIVTRMMTRLSFPAAATLLLVAPAAFGQTALDNALAPAPEMDVPTCGSFLAAEGAQRIGMLMGIQPLGDEIDASDADAARQWSDEVAKACGDAKDRPLADAAQQALLAVP